MPPDRDVIATAAIITVLTRLHRPSVEASVRALLPDLQTRNHRSFVDYLDRHHGDSPLPRTLVQRALGLLAELGQDSTGSVVLHGDLHHDNVLRASGVSRPDPQPWLAIDPHGVVGDPGAEVGPMLYHPFPDRRDPALLALVPARVEQLADGLGMPADRVVAWGFVQAVLSCGWSVADNQPLTRALDVAVALARSMP
jgi:streptomycin 6-kinase